MERLTQTLILTFSLRAKELGLNRLGTHPLLSSPLGRRIQDEGIGADSNADGVFGSGLRRLIFLELARVRA